MHTGPASAETLALAGLARPPARDAGTEGHGRPAPAACARGPRGPAVPRRKHWQRGVCARPPWSQQRLGCGCFSHDPCVNLSPVWILCTDTHAHTCRCAHTHSHTHAYAHTLDTYKHSHSPTHAHVCMLPHTPTHMHAHTHLYACTHLHACAPTPTHMHTSTCMYSHSPIRMHTPTCTHTCTRTHPFLTATTLGHQELGAGRHGAGTGLLSSPTG